MSNESIFPQLTGGAYTVDGQDTVQPLDGFPQSDVGAPCPIVVADEHTVFVSFYLSARDPVWKAANTQTDAPDTSNDFVIVAHFEQVIAHYFGPPNDEAFSGHPLAERGLEPYGAFEVFSSSWIRALERMNRVHEYHETEHFAAYRHFILTFHDSIFECVAHGLTATVEPHTDNLLSLVYRLVGSL